MPMPPEMVVRLRLLGFKQEAIRHWMDEYHKATPEAWWKWLTNLETEPDLLNRSLRTYNSRNYPDSW